MLQEDLSGVKGLKADKAANSRRNGGNNTARYYYESARKIGFTENQDEVVFLCMTSKTNVLSLMPTKCEM